jgi:hypothetical protein
MATVTFVLDGDSTRRLIKRKIGKNPTPAEIEAFCISTKMADESIKECYYYDCAPFGERRPLPIFSSSPRSSVVMQAPTLQRQQRGRADAGLYSDAFPAKL